MPWTGKSSTGNFWPPNAGTRAPKSVLPALFPDDAALDYKALIIQAGEMASMTYADQDRIDDESERQKIRASLTEYSKPDTLAMVTIWQEFSGIAEVS